jgi:hypothetical protein
MHSNGFKEYMIITHTTITSLERCYDDGDGVIEL